jgi:myosin heavy subunit
MAAPTNRAGRQGIRRQAPPGKYPLNNPKIDYYMMPSITPRLLAVLIALFSSYTCAQGLELERRKVEEYQQQMAALEQSNSSIEKQLHKLEQEIADRSDTNTPAARALKEAEFEYQQALRTSERVPSASNKEHAETARFAFLLAQRKYLRSTQNVSKLARQQARLREQLESNQRQIATTGEQLDRQQESILLKEKQARQQASAQARKEKELRIKKESALRISREELERARAERAAALAELEKLKARLASKKQAPTARLGVLPAAGVTVASRQSTLPASVPARDTPEPASVTPPHSEIATSAADGLPSLLGDKAQYLALLETAKQERSRSRSSKIMQMNTLADDRVIRRTSHTLKHKGNGVYVGKTPVRAGMTTLVVGSKQWRWTIPKTDDNTVYRFLLDTRNRSNTELKIFRVADLK